MGRHFEVRAASMAASAAKKSAIYMRASKEIYVAAKSGVPDPNANLALRSAIEKYRKLCPRDVIDRAIKKAQGGAAENYISGRYEFFGPGGSYIIVDTLSDNVNRALTNVKTACTKHGGRMGQVSYNFTQQGILVFKFDNREKIEEVLILGDVNVNEVSVDNGIAEVLVAPNDLAKAKDVLKELNVTEFETCEIRMIANEMVTLDNLEDKEKFQAMMDALDEVEDVQEVYHNVNL